jgi:haloacetate dehalogenase
LRGQGTIGALYDVLETWREKAPDVREKALDRGHLATGGVAGSIL